MVLEITNNKRNDVELLEKIMAEAEKRASASQDESRTDPHDEYFAESGMGRSRETGNLIDCLGKVLQEV